MYRMNVSYSLTTKGLTEFYFFMSEAITLENFTLIFFFYNVIKEQNEIILRRIYYTYSKVSRQVSYPTRKKKFIIIFFKYITPLGLAHIKNFIT